MVIQPIFLLILFPISRSKNCSEFFIPSLHSQPLLTFRCGFCYQASGQHDKAYHNHRGQWGSYCHKNTKHLQKHRDQLQDGRGIWWNNCRWPEGQGESGKVNIRNGGLWDSKRKRLISGVGYYGRLSGTRSIKPYSAGMSQLNTELVCPFPSFFLRKHLPSATENGPPRGSICFWLQCSGFLFSCF